MKIFVTVGTHEQQFNRLLEEMDKIASKNDSYEVFIQSGYSDYNIKHCEYSKLLTYDQMEEHINSADIVITHGGPASFISVLSKNKTPIVVPRQFSFKEHVNDHQVEFVEFLETQGINIVPIYDVKDLENNITLLSKEKLNNTKYSSNNAFFIQGLEEKISLLVK